MAGSEAVDTACNETEVVDEKVAVVDEEVAVVGHKVNRLDESGVLDRFTH